jgi:hypothetical protein
VGTREFKTLFCERFNCPPADYEARAFGWLLYRHARVVARLIRSMWPEFFERDFEFLRALGRVTDAREADAEAMLFRDTEHYHGGFLRRRWRIRVSGRKATALASELFREAG